jgi:hypothetical protein
VNFSPKTFRLSDNGRKSDLEAVVRTTTASEAAEAKAEAGMATIRADSGRILAKSC